MGLGRRVVRNRLVRLVAITSIVIGATMTALAWRRAVVERRLTRDASAGRLHHAADAGRTAMLQEIARIRATLRDVVDAPAGVRSATLAELAGNDAGRTAMLFEDQRLTLFPARALRYVPDPHRRDLASLIARHERLSLLPRPSRSAEAVALVHDLESGTWTLSRSTYEWYRDELDYLVPGDRDIPLWEEAVHAVRAASRATVDRGGEQVIWIDESHPVLLVWRSGQAAAVALAVTPGDVADRWLAAERGAVYGIETVDDRAFLPRPPGDPHTERLLSFAGYEWRMITVARSPDRRASDQ